LSFYQGKQSPSDYHLFPELKQNLGGYRFKDDLDVENGCDTMADDTDICQQAIIKARPTLQ
jgi:hypothetical protein